MDNWLFVEAAEAIDKFKEAQANQDASGVNYFAGKASGLETAKRAFEEFRYNHLMSLYNRSDN